MSRIRGRPFLPGNTQGRGRPKGSRNKAASPEQHLLDQYGEHLTRKCISMAMQGNLGAMRLCMERISPARQDAYIRMNLPPIQTAQDMDKAGEKVTQAIRRGAITPVEGTRLIHIIESRSRVLERVHLESRIQELEATVAAADTRRGGLKLVG